MKALTRLTLLIACLTVGIATAGGQTTAPAAADSTVRYPDHYGDIHISAWLDTSAMTIGDQQNLNILIENAKGSQVVFPKEEEMTFPDLEVLEISSDTVGKDITFHALFTSFEAGTHTVPTIVLQLEKEGENVLLSPSDSLVFEVAYVDDADTVKCETKADIDVIKEPLTFWEIARWGVSALVLAAVVAALLWIMKRRKEHKPIVVLPKSKPLPADRRALNELESLRRKELWQKGRVKRYYTDLTDIVRRLLRNMYGISAAEMTTRQTLRAFHGIADWSEESESLLQQLLQKADMVKFAKSQPEAHEHDEAMQFAVDFVRKVADTHRINNPEEKTES